MNFSGSSVVSLQQEFPDHTELMEKLEMEIVIIGKVTNNSALLFYELKVESLPEEIGTSLPLQHYANRKGEVHLLNRREKRVLLKSGSLVYYRHLITLYGNRPDEELAAGIQALREAIKMRSHLQQLLMNTHHVHHACQAIAHSSGGIGMALNLMHENARCAPVRQPICHCEIQM